MNDSELVFDMMVEDLSYDFEVVDVDNAHQVAKVLRSEDLIGDATNSGGCRVDFKVYDNRCQVFYTNQNGDEVILDHIKLPLRVKQFVRELLAIEDGIDA